MSIVFGFDLGTGSLAAAIRKDDKIVWKRSFLFPEGYASTQQGREKRRMSRTRNAHRAREYAWNVHCKALGIPVLKEFELKKNGDYRVIHGSIQPELLREFPAKGDSTVYNSALLRIMILEGKIKELQPWQIYKAIHSAIQKRGYDPQVPWMRKAPAVVKDLDDDAEGNLTEGELLTDVTPKTKGAKNAKAPAKKTNAKKIEDEDALETKLEKKAKESKDDEETQVNLDKFNTHLAELGLPQKYQLCCYFDAHKMGLWSPDKGVLSVRIDHHAKQAAVDDFKGYTPPRKMVEEELKRLLTEIKKVYQDLDPDYILHGSSREAYGSHNVKIAKELRLKAGGVGDWEGVLGQKIPRFDNRIIDKCLLIPRLNVAKKAAKASGADQNLFYEFDVAMGLHQMRVQGNDLEPRNLSLTEYRPLFEHFRDPKNRWTKRRMQTELKTRNLKFISGREEVKAVSQETTGRSGFSRVSVRQIIEMLWEGYSPSEYKEVLLKRPVSQKSTVTIHDNKEPSKGLIASDLKWLDEIIDCTWDNFYLPQVKYKNPYEKNDSRQAITELFSNVNDPVIRHRLSMLGRTIDEMASFTSKQFQQRSPDNVCLELVRDDFLSEKKKKEIQASQLKNQKDNERLRKLAAKYQLDGKDMILRLKLWENQDGRCPYTNASLSQTKLADYEIDHIFPASRGGPDNQWNYVLTTREVNKDQKMEQTPYEWLSKNPVTWKAFCDNVNQMEKLSHTTRRLLMEKNPEGIIEKKTHIAETAHMAKLAVGLINLKFGWLPHTFGHERRVITVSGGVTAMVRRRYKLDGILAPEEEIKNRDDDRHHMLDAMVLCYLPHWLNNKEKREKFKLPTGIDKNYFSSLIENHLPLNIPESPKLEENFYGKHGSSHVTRRDQVVDVAIKKVNFKDVFAPKSFEAWSQKLKNSGTLDKSMSAYLEKLSLFIQEIPPQEIENGAGLEKWLRKIQKTTLKNGTVPKKIKTFDSLHSEHRKRQDSPHAPEGYIKPKGSHKGFFICSKIENSKKVQKSSEPSWEAVALYAWESFSQKKAQLDGQKRRIYCFVRSGDYIEVKRKIGDQIKLGVYKLNSIMGGSQLEITDIQDPALRLPKLVINRFVNEGQFIPLEAGAEIHL